MAIHMNRRTMLALAAAGAVLQRDGQHAETHSAWRARVDAAHARMVEARGKVESTSLEAARVDALCRALRSAPTTAAARQVEALHAVMAHPGVEVVLSEPGASGDVVDVMVHGRPWWMASGGELRWAGLVLRDALRKLAAAKYAEAGALRWMQLPVVVDEAQSWSGSWDGAWAGPVWRLVTEEHEDGAAALRVFGVANG